MPASPANSCPSASEGARRASSSPSTLAPARTSRRIGQWADQLRLNSLVRRQSPGRRVLPHWQVRVLRTTARCIPPRDEGFPGAFGWSTGQSS
jgi:hypothetical protein